MLKRFFITAAVALVVAGTGLFVWSNRGPRYEGRLAGYWVRQLVRQPEKAKRALLELGPTAVPSLTGAVIARQSWLQRKLDPLRPGWPRWIVRYLPVPFEIELRRWYAMEVLGKLGPAAAPAIPALVDLDDGSSDGFYIPFAAERIILNVGDAGIPQLITVLTSDKNFKARARAASCLGRLGAKGPSAAIALAKALNDSNPSVRAAGVYALAQIGPPASNALPALHAALKLDDDDFRLQVIYALWKVGRESETTVPILIKILSDWNNPNRAGAATLLGDLGPAAKAAVPALTSVLREEFSYTRVRAEEALQQIDPLPSPGTTP